MVVGLLIWVLRGEGVSRTESFGVNHSRHQPRTGSASCGGGVPLRRRAVQRLPVMWQKLGYPRSRMRWKPADDVTKVFSWIDLIKLAAIYQ